MKWLWMEVLPGDEAKGQVQKVGRWEGDTSAGKESSVLAAGEMAMGAVREPSSRSHQSRGKS